jgi:preprotein translocase subunit SecE
MSKAIQGESFFSSFFGTGIYKRTQGRLVRQATAVAIIALVAVGCWRLKGTVLSDYSQSVQLLVPVAVGLLGVWAAYRIVNYPPFTNFLISVEAEMAKVNWPSWEYLRRAAIVVVGTMVLFAAFLALCDYLWVALFQLIGFLEIKV